MTTGLSGDAARELERMQERAEAPAAPAWIPGDRSKGHPASIAGEVVETSLKLGAGYEGRDVKTVTVRTLEGAEWCVWMHETVLQQELGAVAEGDLVVLSYLGKKEGKHSTYHSYRVVVRRRDPAAAAAEVSSPAAEPAREPAPPEPGNAEVQCEACHLYEPHHADGCPQAIPF